MSYRIKTIPIFDKQIKRLSKKYPSLKNDFITFLASLQNEPRQGVSLGNNCFKIRFLITSKGKGMSGGARIITHLVVSDQIIYLINLYDKSEKASISTSELKELLTSIPK